MTTATGTPPPGKRSPDGRFREYKHNREIARDVVEHLQFRGYDGQLLVPEEEDIPLKERVRRASSLSDELATCLYKAARHHLPGHKLRTDTQPCQGFLYFEVSISDNSPSTVFYDIILWHFLIRLYIIIC